MDHLRRPVIWLCWRDGARMPLSFHASEAEARRLAEIRVRAGDTICVLRAELVATVAAAPPVITVSETPHESR